MGQEASVELSTTQINIDSVIYPNGDTYEGALQDGKRHGKGIYKTTKGSKYDGEWFDDKKHGKGTYYYKQTGECYTGDWVENKKHGFGTYSYNDNSTYYGEWKHNKKWGQGTFQRSDFTGWKGPWIDNKMHGVGEGFDSAGNKFVEKYDKGRLIHKESPLPLSSSLKPSNTLEMREDIRSLSINDFGESVVSGMSYERSNPLKWTELDCCDFLRIIGMFEYKHSFIENGIDGVTLLKVEEKDLKELGVRAKGHRIKLRESIKKLRALTKERFRKKFMPAKKELPQLMSNQLPNSIENKLRSYYDNLNIVEEVDQQEEEADLVIEDDEESIPTIKIGGSGRRRVKSGSKEDASLNKSTKKSGVTKKSEITDPNAPIQLKQLVLHKSLSTPNIKRRTLSENDIFLEDTLGNNFTDDYQLSNQSRENLSIIHEREKDLEWSFAEPDTTGKNMYRDSDFSTNIQLQNEDAKSNLAQPTSSSSSSVSSSSSSNSNDTKQKKRSLHGNHLKISEKKITKLEQISNKPYCTGYKGLYAGQEVFIKEYIRKGKRYTRGSKAIISESNKIFNTNHRNIVRFIGICLGSDHFYTLTEYMNNGSLYDQIHIINKQLDEKMVVKLLVSIARSMNFLHGISQVHGDLKSTNVLITEDWEFKLIDFGFNKLKEKFKRFRKLKKRKDAETPYWLAPEILNEEKYGREIDIYAFGVLIWYSSKINRKGDTFKRDSLSRSKS